MSELITRAGIVAKTRLTEAAGIIAELAGWLEARGVGEGDRVAYLLPNLPQMLIGDPEYYGRFFGFTAFTFPTTIYRREGLLLPLSDECMAHNQC